MDDWPFTDFDVMYRDDHTVFFLEEEIKDRFGV